MVTYSSAFLPPAPTLEVVVHNAQTGASTTVLAKIDTGADGSVIPVTLVEQLGLIPFDTLVSIAFDGSTEEQTSYMIDLTIAGRTFTDLEVITAPLAYVLIGRDVLNHVVTILNGPDQVFDIR
jgi:predicted aspartyl protease